jgi:hypothetical protein
MKKLTVKEVAAWEKAARVSAWIAEETRKAKEKAVEREGKNDPTQKPIN